MPNNYPEIILKDYYPRCGVPTFKGNANFQRKTSYLVKSDYTLYHGSFPSTVLTLPLQYSVSLKRSCIVSCILSVPSYCEVLLSGITFISKSVAFYYQGNKEHHLSLLWGKKVYINDVITIIFECTAFSLIFLNISFFQIIKKRDLIHNV